MFSVSQAQEIVLKLSKPLPPESEPLTQSALGLVLAEDIVSDVDMPPFAKSLMDGYAVRATDVATGQATLTILEEITAGRTPTLPVGQGQASRIMTGAPMPQGADAVVMIERTLQLDSARVVIEDKPARPGQNVLPQGQEMHRGDVVLSPGAVLRPQEFGVLATVGRSAIRVHPAPVVALISTGDEVVDPSRRPGPGQIRNGNGPMLAAQIARAGGVPRDLGIAVDRIDVLSERIADGLRSPMLVLCGGVSAGVADLVPKVLRDLGVEAHFHKVEMKPGKPIFFGTRNQTLVFGLPGNPVSSFVCFELFVRPAIRRLRGHNSPGPEWVRALLTEDYTYRTDRATYHPAWLDANENGWRARAVPWFGSPDLRGLTRANALMLFEPSQTEHRAGNIYPVMRIET
jgi:molybdopterin molybdotransferase